MLGSLLANKQQELQQNTVCTLESLYIQYTSKDKEVYLEGKEYTLIVVSPMSKNFTSLKRCIVLNQCFVLSPMKSFALLFIEFAVSSNTGMMKNQSAYRLSFQIFNELLNKTILATTFMIHVQ